MKFTKNSLMVLNNFRNINKNVVIRKGNILKTISEARTVVAEATLDIEFPSDFGISDLSNFLNTINIFTDPEIEFFEDHVTIKENNIEYDYYRSSDAVLIDPKYGKNPQLGEPICSFQIGKDDLKNIIKAANVIKAVGNSGSVVRFYLNDKSELLVESKLKEKEAFKNVYRLLVKQDDNINKFDFCVDSSNLTLLEDDYEISIYERCAVFKGLNIPVTYYIAYIL